MKVLVCGGRDYKDWNFFKEVMLATHRRRQITSIIHGNALGADTMAQIWAEREKIEVTKFQAEWRKYGKRAGPLRNARMLSDGKPDLVIAFPGGRGTSDMIKQAKAAGVEVIEYALTAGDKHE